MDDWFRFPLTPRAILLKSVMLEYVNSMLNYANSNVTWRQESELRTRIAQHLSGRVRAPDASLLRGMDVSMVAGVGRRPLAQVLAQFALRASADRLRHVVVRPRSYIPIKIGCQ